MQTAPDFAQGVMGTEKLMDCPGYKPRPDRRPMKALAWFGNKDVRIVDTPVPAIVQPDDVIVKVTGTSISGSDLHLYRGEVMDLRGRDILGHEFVGEVDEVGSQVRNVKPGHRVVASFQIACGHCEYCNQKLSSFCVNMNHLMAREEGFEKRESAPFGLQFAGGFPGGQAEYVRVPKGDVNLLPIPDNVSDEKALFLSELIPTGYHTVVDTGVKEGDTVGIWGAGPVGLCTARWALVKGASRVIMIDSIQDRLDLASEMLSVDTVNFKTHTNVPQTIYELTKGRGLDVAIDCGTFQEPKSLIHKVQKTLMLETDVPETINEMLVSVRKVGRCGITATYVGYANGVNVGALMEKGIRHSSLIGNGQAPVHLYWEEILNEYIIPGKFDPTFMITHRVPLEDLPRVYQIYDERKGGIEKVFVQTKFYKSPKPGTPELTRVSDWVI